MSGTCTTGQSLLRTFVTCAFLACACLACTTVSCGRATGVTLYALQYGSSLFPAREVFATPPSGTPEKIPFAWLFYLVKTPDAIVLIDTGFRDEELALRLGMQYEDPVVVLKKAGIAADDITDIIITHAHFDHIDGVDAFPKAQIHIHSDAYDSFMKNPPIPRIAQFLRQNKNVETFTGTYCLGKYITVIPVGGHAPGSCVVHVDIPSGRILLTGDEAYVNENVNQVIPVGSAVNQAANLEFLRNTHASGMRFFTFHSPDVVQPPGQVWVEID